MHKNELRISVNGQYDPTKGKEYNNDKVAIGWSLTNYTWTEDSVRKLTIHRGISCNEYPSGHRGKDDWVATHAIMLDFDGGTPSQHDLLEQQKTWNHDSYLYSSQNHQKAKKGIICDRLRVLIPLSEPITNERDRKAVDAYFCEKYPTIDKTFLDRHMYFAHGTTTVSSFQHSQGPFDWTQIPNLDDYRDKVVVSTWKKKEDQLVRLNNEVLDHEKRSLRIEQVVPGSPIFCPFCGQSDERGGDSHNAVIKINENNLPFLFCSSCKSRGNGHDGVYNFDDIDGIVYRLNLDDKLIFIDTLKSKYMGGCEEPGLTGFVCRELSGKEHVQQFCRAHKVPFPEVFPRARYELVFESDKRADFSQGFVNIYDAPEVLRNPVPKDWVQKRPEYIHRLIDHVFAHDSDIIDRFYNNLAWFVKTRQKMITSFLMQGVEGTGKGFLFTNVFQNIFGERFASQADQDAFGGQFNSFLTNNVLVLINEVSGNFTSSAGKNLSTIEKMKIAITDESIQIEGKNKDRYNGKNVCSFLFATNRRDGITLSDNDRRFNVAPRQEVRVDATKWWPEYEELVELVNAELQDFVWYLKTYPADSALIGKVIENAPKKVLQVMSKQNAELFFDAVKAGDIKWIMENLVQEKYGDFSAVNFAEIQTLARGLKSKDRVSVDTLRALYNNITGKELEPIKFGRIAAGFLEGESKPMKIDGKSSRGYMIDWDDFSLIDDE